MWGGIRTKTITEDFATGIDIQAKGYTCFAIEKVLASGLAPDDFPNLLKQRQRWGRGCVQTIRSLKFWFGKLPLVSKLSYFSCLLYWWTFLRRFIYILSPILFSVFGVLVVKTDLIGILCIWLPSYLIYNHSLKVLSGKVRDQKWSNIVDTILFPYMILPILAETLGLRMKKFSVTNKNKSVSRSAKVIYAIPHMMLLGATGVGIYFSIAHMVLYQTILGGVVLFWLGMNAYFLTMAIFFLLGRINYRMSQRFYAQMPITFNVGTRKINGVTSDISEFGLAFKLDFPEFVNGVCEFTLKDTPWTAKVRGKVVHVDQIGNQWKYSVKLEPLTQEEKQDYDQIVFDRFPTLATEIKTSTIKDLSVFFQKKMSHQISSKRKLPRIMLNCNLQTEDGTKVMVADYNYQYMTIEEGAPSADFCIKLGEVMLHLKQIAMQGTGKENLYEVENWESLSILDSIRNELGKLIGEPSNERELQKV